MRIALDFDLTTRTDRGCMIVAVTGELDVYTAPRLREELLDNIAANDPRLIVDLQGVEFMDSSGLGVLVGALKRVRAHGGELRLVCDRPLMLKTFRITGLSRVFAIYASLSEALEQAALASSATDLPSTDG